MREATESYTAKRLGINNIPSDYQLTNMAGVAENIFEPLRKWVDGPIKINSFFRSPELNKAIGGSSKSQHCEGRAIDNNPAQIAIMVFTLTLNFVFSLSSDIIYFF